MNNQIVGFLELITHNCEKVPKDSKLPPPNKQFKGKNNENTV